MGRGSFGDEEEPTRPDVARPPLLRPSLVQRAEADQGDDDFSRMGMVMRQTVANTAAIESMQVQLSTFGRELRQHSRGIESDRPALAKEAAKGAAKHTSNRLAVIMGGLFTVYEVAAPYVHQIWEAWRAHR